MFVSSYKLWMPFVIRKFIRESLKIKPPYGHVILKKLAYFFDFSFPLFIFKILKILP